MDHSNTAATEAIAQQPDLDQLAQIIFNMQTSADKEHRAQLETQVDELGKLEPPFLEYYAALLAPLQKMSSIEHEIDKYAASAQRTRLIARKIKIMP